MNEHWTHAHCCVPREPSALLPNMLRVLCCIVALAHGFHLHALGIGKPLREYGQQSWQSDSGLSQNTVHAIVQTREGYLWIGTEAGLVRFDGVDFAVFDTRTTPALHSDFITSLVQDERGSLWIGTQDGLVREEAGAFARFGRPEGLPASSILTMYVTRRGRLVALTSLGAAVFDAGHFALLAGTSGLGLSEGASMLAEDQRGGMWIAGREGVVSIQGNRANPVAEGEVGELHALAVNSTGDLWVGGASGLKVLSGVSGQANEGFELLPSKSVTSLLPDKDDVMWIGTSKGLAQASHGVVRVIRELAGMWVQSLFLDRAGTLWVTTSEGIARITNGTVDLATRKPMLNDVLSVLEDREGNMWFGTETTGLHVLRDQAFSTITVEDGLSASLVRSVFEDHAGTMWVGTSGGGLDRIAGARVSHFHGLLPSRVILAIDETNVAGTYSLWVGTPEGLVRICGDKITVFTTADGLADDFVRSLYADSDGSLWVGTRNGLSHLKNNRFQSYSTLDGLPSDLIGTILRGRAGDLWVGTLGGLSRMTGNTFVKLPGGLEEGAVTSMIEDTDGSLWVGINGRSLSLLRDGRVTALSGDNVSLPNLPATIYGILEDEEGDLWLSSRTGVDRVSLAALHALAHQHNSLPVTHYGIADGMRISETSGGGHPASWRARDGGLWFATLNGVAVIHPRSGPRNPVPPLSTIEQVLIDDQPVAILGKDVSIKVAPGHGSLSIRYAGLSFVAPQRVDYRYMLEGFDNGWIHAGHRRAAYYTNLPPGSYRFLVSSSNRDGVWSATAAEQRFTIQPFFYQTAWFFAFMVFALIGLSYLVYKWRVITIEAQYRAVVDERGRIAREIHDTLAQGYVAIAVQLELAERLIASSTDAAVQQLKQTKEMVREGLAEARRSIWNLRSQTDAKALPALLATYIASASRRDPGSAVIKFVVHGAYRPLTSNVEVEVMRVAQQAVLNALAHARASFINVTLSYDGQWMDLCVADDGVGMSQILTESQGRGHFGLQGMRERAARIGAMLKVDSSPGCGVTVSLKVDLRSAAGRDKS